jgi:hypothetical protein
VYGELITLKSGLPLSDGTSTRHNHPLVDDTLKHGLPERSTAYNISIWFLSRRTVLFTFENSCQYAKQRERPGCRRQLVSTEGYELKTRHTSSEAISRLAREII